MNAQKIVNHFDRLYKNKAVYLWGANCEVITKQLTDKLFSWFGSKDYPKSYYENKLKEGIGRIGADCSGSFKPVSGRDKTAQAYYDECKIKGSIGKLQCHRVCLVFKKSFSGRITHIGLYCGNGYTIEMKSSKENCVKEILKPWRWTYYGIPEWIENVNPYEVPTKTVQLGSEDESVKWVQYELCEDGIIVDVDGKCGKQTDKAIKEYQKKHKLLVDGKAGPITVNKMK